MKILSAILALTCSVAAVAQQPAVEPLTLDDALEMTLTENPSVRATQHNLLSAEASRRAAVGLRMPKIGLTGAYAYLGKDIGFDLNDMKTPVGSMAQQLLTSGIIPVEQIPTIQGLISPLMGADWTFTLQERSLGFVGGDITVPIWLGGKINAANRAAKIEVASAKAASVRNSHALTSELVERYFGLALARQVVDVRREVVAGVQRHLDDAVKLEENGMIAASERLYVAFKLSDAERELSDAELQVQTIASALSSTLGRDGEWQPVTAMFMVDNIEPLAYFQEMAEEHNALLEQVNLKRSLAAEGVKVERSNFLPQVVAMGGGSFYNYQVTDLVPRWAVGVGVSFKIFDGLNRENKYRASKQTLKRVEALQEKASQDISVLVEKLYNEMLNQRNRMRSVESSMAFAEEYLRMQRASFGEGLSTATQLIDAELNLARVRTERLEAAYRFDLALARLLEAAGLSGDFISYAGRGDARRVIFDKKQ